ncbi:MAG TPA: HD domain-containing protein [Candidatus Nanoarchaeia archaeon]|nr:HD domain-containing protein [Candidatus Nanoarchaeia archaeon]
MGDFVDFFNTAEKLKRVKRAGWVREGVPNAESVADHSFSTALLCYILADSLKVNKDKIIKMALLHDLAEVEAGDNVSHRGDKIVSSIKNKLEKEERVMKKMFSKVDGEEYMNLWIEFTEQKTREAIILKQIDKLEMAFQASEYENTIEPSKLDEFFINTKMNLKEPLLIELFNELEKKRKNK